MSIFVSYSAVDREWVQRLVNDVREEGFGVWFDADSIFPGQSIPAAIAEGLEISRIVVVVCSESAIKSPWVNEELEGALYRAVTDPDRIVIPVLRECCALPPLLAHRQHFDLTDYDAKIAEFLDWVRQIEDQSDGPGFKIPGYRDLKLIGEGGFGQVYRCFSLKKNLSCALKLSKSKSLPVRLEQEIQNVLAESPYVVPVIDSGTWHGKSFIVMPYVGHSLKWHLRQQTFKFHQIDAILSIADGILNAIMSAHSKGIIHCDIKPSNILIDDIGRPLLCDFGLSNNQTSLSFKYSTLVRGTICYMSPEQQLGLEVDRQTDIYSFGAVLYELLTGTKAVGRYRDVSSINDLVPSSIEGIVDRCLEVDRESRYKSASAVKKDLTTARRNLTVAKKLRNRRRRLTPIVFSSVMRELVDKVKRLSELDVNCMFLGPTGVGKSLLALWSHSMSPRAARPYVEMNASVIPETLAASELFGHAKGAFTGATERRIGYIERANGGTLFVDEVADLPLGLQGYLLRVLENGTYTKLGEDKERLVDVRWIFASNKDVYAMARNGGFRADLLARIRFGLQVPPLTERSEDILPLIKSFAAEIGFRIVIPPAVRGLVLDYLWPENVREVESFVTHLVSFSDKEGDIITFDEKTFREFCAEHRGHVEEPIRPLSVVERAYIIKALRFFEGRKEEAAKALGVTLSVLSVKLEEYGLLHDEWRKDETKG